MKKILILHAWYSKPSDNWYPWLKKELEGRGYEVLLPELPTMNTDLPDMEMQLKTIQEVAPIDENTIIIGHKLFWPNKISHKRIMENVKEIYSLTSDNDRYFTAYQAEEMSKRLGGKFILVKGAGHFTLKDGITKIPQILSLI